MHISTQCNVTNFEVVRFFAQYADVIVLAREVVLEQVMEIHRRIVGEDLRGPNGGGSLYVCFREMLFEFAREKRFC